MPTWVSGGTCNFCGHRDDHFFMINTSQTNILQCASCEGGLCKPPGAAEPKTDNMRTYYHDHKQSGQCTTVQRMLGKIFMGSVEVSITEARQIAEALDAAAADAQFFKLREAAKDG